MQSTLFQKLALRSIGVFGAGIFATFFALTFSAPEWVEQFAADYIEAEAESRIDSTIDALRPPSSESALGRFAESLYQSNEAQIDRLKTNLKSSIREQWAAALVSVRDMDCECRQNWERGVESNITLLQLANEKVVHFIHATYMDLASDLKRDVRVFTGSNAVLFILLLLISFLKPRAVSHLFLPGVLVTISTLICSYFYVFEQNWLLTIIQGSYLGFAYLAWLGIVFLFLCDIVFNRGRVTTEILNALFSAAGSAASVVPC